MLPGAPWMALRGSERSDWSCRNTFDAPAQITNPLGKIVLVTNGLLDVGT